MRGPPSAEAAPQSRTAKAARTSPRRPAEKRKESTSGTEGRTAKKSKPKSASKISKKASKNESALEAQEGEGRDVFEVEDVKGFKIQERNGACEVVFEIKWRGFSDARNTFEPKEHMNTRARKSYRPILEAGERALDAHVMLHSKAKNGAPAPKTSPTFPSRRGPPQKQKRGALDFFADAQGVQEQGRRKSGRKLKGVAGFECPVCRQCFSSFAGLSEHVDMCLQ
jgi:hypothetical protein